MGAEKEDLDADTAKHSSTLVSRSTTLDELRVSNNLYHHAAHDFEESGMCMLTVCALGLECQSDAL